MQDLGKLDVVAMRVLLAVHDRGAFTAAAELLGLAQSTVSHQVGRMRGMFDDPLFVRMGAGVAPTPRGAEICRRLRPILDQLDALAEAAPFDPASAAGTLTISCNFHERRLILPGAVRRLRAEAPGLRLALHEAAVDGRRQLSEGAADMVIGPVAILGDMFYRRALFADRYVCVMDPGAPATRGGLDLAAFAAASHLAITHNGRWEAPWIPLVRARGIEPRIALAIPSHDALRPMLAGSDLVATIPGRMARELGEGLSILPFPLPAPIEIDMHWTERTHRAPLHVWARRIVAEAAREGRADEARP